MQRLLLVIIIDELYFFTDMNLFNSFVLFLLGFGMTLMSEVFVMGSGSMLVDPETLHKKCQYFREKSMLASSCRNLGIEEIPSTLRSDVEVKFSPTGKVTENNVNFT